MKKRKKSVVDCVVYIGTPILIFIIWQILCDKEVLNKAIVPSPVRVIEKSVELIKGGILWENLWASFRRVLVGFFFGAITGVAFGVLMGLFAKINEAVAIVFGVLRPIPTIGLVPLFIMLFGIGEKSKIIVIAIGTFWSVLLNTEHGITNIDIKYLEVANVLEKSRKTILMKVVFPSAIPSIFTGLRLGLSAAWKSVVAAEMLAAVRGIGYMISYAREMSQPANMFVGLFTIGIIGVAIDSLILRLQNKIIRWN
ncbi:MAG: ABC transporter permease [Lachnospiraceae bacterium]|nr:ABC transporter permease [Lachnospiraceae bacterium]